MSEMQEALEEMRQALMRGTCEPSLGKGYAALATALERLDWMEREINRAGEALFNNTDEDNLKALGSAVEGVVDTMQNDAEELAQAERRVKTLEENITRRCYRRVPVEENQEMQFLGAHVLSWEPDHCPIGPTVAFVECDNEWLDALKEADGE